MIQKTAKELLRKDIEEAKTEGLSIPIRESEVDWNSRPLLQTYLELQLDTIIQTALEEYYGKPITLTLDGLAAFVAKLLRENHYLLFQVAWSPLPSKQLIPMLLALLKALKSPNRRAERLLISELTKAEPAVSKNILRVVGPEEVTQPWRT